MYEHSGYLYPYHNWCCQRSGFWISNRCVVVFHCHFNLHFPNEMKMKLYTGSKICNGNSIIITKENRINTAGVGDLN